MKSLCFRAAVFQKCHPICAPGNKWLDKKHPVENVSYYDVASFISRYRKLHGIGYRLPTLAEFKYLQAVGKTEKYYYLHPDHYREAPYSPDNLMWHTGNADGKTHKVGQLLPNSFGLYDISGNVWEWTQDWEGLEKFDSFIDPKGPESGTKKAVLGGGWNREQDDGCWFPDECRFGYYKEGVNPKSKSPAIGFRLVKELPFCASIPIEIANDDSSAEYSFQMPSTFSQTLLFIRFEYFSSAESESENPRPIRLAIGKGETPKTVEIDHQSVWTPLYDAVDVTNYVSPGENTARFLAPDGAGMMISSFMVNYMPAEGTDTADCPALQ